MLTAPDGLPGRGAVNKELLEACKATLPILAYPSAMGETIIRVVREKVRAAIQKAVQP